MASDIENEKRSMRTAALAMRASLPPELRAEYSRAICRRLYEHPALSKAERVMLYAAAGTEPDLTELAGLLSADGKRLYYPVCCAEGLMYAASPDKQTHGGQESTALPSLTRSIRRLFPRKSLMRSSFPASHLMRRTGVWVTAVGTMTVFCRSVRVL